MTYYNLVHHAGEARFAGSLAAATPDLLVAAGLPRLVSFQVMFYAYAALGLVGVEVQRLVLRTTQDALLDLHQRRFRTAAHHTPFSQMPTTRAR